MSRDNGTARALRIRVLQVLDANPDGLTITELDAVYHGTRVGLLRTIRELEYMGQIRHDPKTDHYMTEPDMRRKNRDHQNSAPAGANHLDYSPAGAVSLEQQREALVLAMEGPAAVALDAVRDEPTLHARLTLAMEQGLPAPDLSTVPRYRRAAFIEDTLNEWERGTHGGPCSICGCVAARDGYFPRSSMEVPSMPSFTNGKCDFCREVLVANPDRDMLRHRVLKAVVGLHSLNGSGAGVLFYDEVKQHVPTLRPGQPWEFLSGPILRLMVDTFHPERWQYITTDRDSRLHSFDTITAPIHTEATLPPVPSRPDLPPHTLSPAAIAANREWERFQADAADRRARWHKRRQDMLASFDRWDERLAAMTPGERARELEETARQEASARYGRSDSDAPLLATR